MFVDFVPDTLVILILEWYSISDIKDLHTSISKKFSGSPYNSLNDCCLCLDVVLITSLID